MGSLISNCSELRPDTAWRDTIWSAVSEEQLVDHSASPRLCVAALLPFKDAKPDWEGFLRCIHWMRSAAAHYGIEIVFVLNADTGYIFELDRATYAEVLARFRSEFPEQRFIAGITGRKPVEAPGRFDPADYLPMLEIAQQYRNAEVMLMTSPALASLPPENRRDAYYSLAELVTLPALVHALDPAFVPWATTFEPWLLNELAKNGRFIGGKVSTLSEPHFLYWAALCRDAAPFFIPHSGDDYGLATAIRLGLPLLVGAGASAAPLLCAAMAMWRNTPGSKAFDARVFKLFESVQSMEDIVFRLDDSGSAGGYKHSTATVLQILGLIESSETHPNCRTLRSPDEPRRMREAMERPLRLARELGIPGFSC